MTSSRRLRKGFDAETTNHLQASWVPSPSHHVPAPHRPATVPGHLHDPQGFWQTLLECLAHDRRWETLLLPVWRTVAGCEVSTGVRIYLAAPFSEQSLMRRWRSRLESVGHTITSRWLDEIPGCPLSEYAEQDLEDIRVSQVLLLHSKEGVRGGRHVEFGYALARGVHCVVIGRLQNIFHDLPTVSHYRSFTAALRDFTVLYPQ